MKCRLIISSFAIALLMTGCGESNIEQSCTMNGFGTGTCSFTNSGDGAGSLCGKIIVSTIRGAERAEESSKFCSGKVEPSSTTQVQFSVPAVRSICEPWMSNQSWTDVCEFTFIADK